MQQINYPNRKQWATLLSRTKAQLKAYQDETLQIIEAIKEGGDDALLFYAQETATVPIESFRLTNGEIQRADEAMPKEAKEAIYEAKTYLEKYHFMQAEVHRKLETAPDVYCWRDAHALKRIGIFIDDEGPERFSSLLMYAVPALIAGVEEIVLCATPGRDGKLNASLVWAAGMLGIKEFFKLDGPQAFAAMSLGTPELPKVHKVFGKGDERCAAMKMTLLAEGFLVDMPSTIQGTADLVVFADKGSHAKDLAFEIAIHNKMERRGKIIVFVDDEETRDEIASEVRAKQAFMPVPPSKSGTKRGYANYLVLSKNRNNAVNFTNQFAPDHLIIATKDAEILAREITAAGTVYVGADTSKTAAHYASGVATISASMGMTRQMSSVSVDSFRRKVNFVKMDQEGFLGTAKLAEQMGSAEGYQDIQREMAERIRKIENPYGGF